MKLGFVMRLLYPASCLLKQSVSASHKLTSLFVKTSDAASMQLFSDCCRTRRFFLKLYYFRSYLMSDEVRVRYALALSGILPPKAISFCFA